MVASYPITNEIDLSLRTFFRENYSALKVPHYLPFHFDLWIYQRIIPLKHIPLFYSKNGKIWTDSNGRIQAFLYSEEGENDFSLVVDNACSMSYSEFISWAITNWKTEFKQLVTFQYEYENAEPLTELGFRKGEVVAVCFEFNLSEIQEFRIGKKEISTIKDSKRLTEQCRTRKICFGGNESPLTRFDLELYSYLRQSPSYREQLDFFIAKDEVNASSCIVFVDDELKVGIIESLCTLPKYRNKGLARKLIRHSLNTLKAKGFRRAYLYSESPATYSLYRSAGPSREFQLYEYICDSR